MALGDVFSALTTLWQGGILCGHGSSSDQWGGIVSGECLFGFPRFPRQILTSTFPNFFILISIWLFLVFFLSISSVSESFVAAALLFRFQIVFPFFLRCVSLLLRFFPFAIYIFCLLCFFEMHMSLLNGRLH